MLKSVDCLLVICTLHTLRGIVTTDILFGIEQPALGILQRPSVHQPESKLLAHEVGMVPARHHMTDYVLEGNVGTKYVEIDKRLVRSFGKANPKVPQRVIPCPRRI
jgi:hypothetical protein